MKIPSIFRKRYSEQDLQKKILRHIYILKDRTYLEELFIRGEDGTYGMDLGPEIPKETFQRLKTLSKAIKANRSRVQGKKILILVIVTAGIGIGYYLFRNSLIERALEGSLQALFQAKVDVRGLDFDPFRGRIVWNALEVADQDRPMKNLFELNNAAADLHMAALLRGRFVVETLEVLDIRWNTDRKTSGALSKPVAKSEKPEGPGMIETVSTSVLSALSGFDPKALVDQEYEKLKTVKTAERVKGELEALKASWSDRISNSRKEIEETGKMVKELSSVNIKEIKTLDEAQALYTQVKDVVPKVQRLSASTGALQNEFNTSLKTVESLKKDIEKAINEDYGYLESLVHISREDAGSFARDLFEDYASKNLGAFYMYGKRGIQIVQNLKDAGGKKQKGTDKPRRSEGRTIQFPLREEFPQLWIKHTALSATGSSASSFKGQVDNISSDPDLIEKPATFSFSQKLSPSTFGIEGALDLRKDTEQPLSMNISAENLRTQIDLPLPILTIKSLKGSLSTTTSFGLSKEGDMEGTIQAILASPTVERVGKGEAISDLAYSILTGTSAVDVSGTYKISSRGNIDLRLSSSLDRVIQEKLKDFLKEQEQKYRALVKEEARKRFEGVLAENEMLSAGFSELEKAMGGNLSSVENYKKIVEEKQREIEKRSAELKKQATDTLLKEAEKVVPSLPKAPSLPKSIEMKRDR